MLMMTDHAQHYAVNNITPMTDTTCSLYSQEAQLSHRDRAILRAIEYFAKSLKITQDHSK